MLSYLLRSWCGFTNTILPLFLSFLYTAFTPVLKLLWCFFFCFYRKTWTTTKWFGYLKIFGVIQSYVCISKRSDWFFGKDWCCIFPIFLFVQLQIKTLVFLPKGFFNAEFIFCFHSKAYWAALFLKKNLSLTAVIWLNSNGICSSILNKTKLLCSLNLSIYISLEKLTCVCTRMDGMRIIQGSCDSFLPTLPCASVALWLMHNCTKRWTNSMELLHVEIDVWVPQDPSVWPLCCGSPMVSWCVPLVVCPPPFLLPVCLHPLTGAGMVRGSRGSRSLTSFPLSSETRIANSLPPCFPKTSVRQAQSGTLLFQ